MERLTDAGREYYDCEFMDSGIAEYMNRLAAYEDTGYDPAEIDDMALSKAAAETIVNQYEAWEKDGTIIRPPCKIGDTVWFVLQDVDEDGRWEVSVPEKITEVGASGFWLSGLRDDPDGKNMFVPWSDLGVEAFLTREAAEAALKEREGT